MSDACTAIVLNVLACNDIHGCAHRCIAFFCVHHPPVSFDCNGLHPCLISSSCVRALIGCRGGRGGHADASVDARDHASLRTTVQGRRARDPARGFVERQSWEPPNHTNSLNNKTHEMGDRI